jgi:hypothetical protein
MILLYGVLLILGLWTMPAFAAPTPPSTDYAGGNGTTTTTGASGTQQMGSHQVGDVFDVQTGGFGPNSDVQTSVNGVQSGGPGRHGGRRVAMVEVVKANAQGLVTHRVRINSCSSITLDGKNASSAANTAVTDAGTTSAGAPNTQTTMFSVAGCTGATQPSTGGTAFTGGNAVRWGSVALGLIAAGGAFVFAARRRHRPIA